MAAMVAAHAMAADGGASEPTRNAIFNGDFIDGRAGWTIGGPADLVVKASHKMIEHRSDSELLVSYEGLEKSLTIFSPHAIGVTPGRSYTLSLTAGGTGSIAFGVYEYADRDKNTIFPISETITLTPELQTYTFTYEASDQAVTIRPRLIIYGKEDGATGDFAVRLTNFSLPMSQSEFAETTQWPEWAVSGELSAYKGLTDEEVRRIREAVEVTGVLAPYEPIRRDGPNEFALTTSRFRFTRSVFPDSISVLDRPILTGKMRFDLRTADGQSISSTRARPQLTADDRQLLAHQTIDGDGWQLDLDGTLAYDALMIFDVKLRAEKPVTISSASLTIPFSGDVARYIRYNKEFGDREFRFGEGPIPAAGETVEVRHTVGRAKNKNDWSPLAPSPALGTLWEWNRGTPTYFWIGDEEKGLGWITESDQGWSCAEGDVTLALERTGEGVRVRLNFITQPTVVKDTWTLRFMIQAMPPKPVRADWFKMRFNRFWNWLPGDAALIERVEAMVDQPAPVLTEDPAPALRYAQVGRGTADLRPPWESLRQRGLKDIGFLWWDVWSVGCGSPQVARPDVMRAYLRVGSYLGHMALPYFAPTHLAIGDLNGYYYAAKTDAWSKVPQAGNTSYYVKICPNSFASEYQAYEIGRLIDEYDIEGVYFDNTHPSRCSNLTHGCGWGDENGITHPSTPFLGMRRLFEMVRNQFLKRGKTPFIMKHAGAFPGAVSFTDAQLDGEGTYGYDHTEMFTPAEFRATYIGPNQFGIVEVYLPQLGTGTDTSEVSSAQQITIGSRRLMALALIHGTPVYCGNINYGYMAAAWGVLDELHGPTVDFIPYWDWPVNETLNPRGIYATLYHQPEQSVLVVANLSASDATVKIPRGELEKLIPGLHSAEDHMDRWPVDLDDKSLRIKVQDKNFRLISLQ
ncbi:MAG TPA: hypothetical protein DGT21_13450 [Armatimonadetes bacterium]|nr:hypothetical protein [Armatimonadota bacterium]